MPDYSDGDVVMDMVSAHQIDYSIFFQYICYRRFQIHQMEVNMMRRTCLCDLLNHICTFNIDKIDTFQIYDHPVEWLNCLCV